MDPIKKNHSQGCHQIWEFRVLWGSLESSFSIRGNQGKSGNSIFNQRKSGEKGFPENSGKIMEVFLLIIPRFRRSDFIITESHLWLNFIVAKFYPSVHHYVLYSHYEVQFCFILQFCNLNCQNKLKALQNAVSVK